jgi:hypothetical protein
MPQSRVRDRPSGGLGVQAKTGHVRQFSDIAFANTNDRDAIAKGHCRSMELFVLQT